MTGFEMSDVVVCPSCLRTSAFLWPCTAPRCLARVCDLCYGDDKLCPPHRAPSPSSSAPRTLQDALEEIADDECREYEASVATDTSRNPTDAQYTHPDALVQQVEQAIRLAAQLGPDAFDFIEGRGLHAMRVQIEKDVAQLRAQPAHQDLPPVSSDIPTVDRITTLLAEAVDSTAALSDRRSALHIAIGLITTLHAAAVRGREDAEHWRSEIERTRRAWESERESSTRALMQVEARYNHLIEHIASGKAMEPPAPLVLNICPKCSGQRPSVGGSDA